MGGREFADIIGIDKLTDIITDYDATHRETVTAKAHGIDVSHWQGEYIRAKTWGQVDFAIAKIGEGYNSPYSEHSLGDFTDFNKIWVGGVDQAEIRGVYFYQRSGYSWQQQADNVLAAIDKLTTKPHMLWLDIEKGNNVIDKTMLADSLRIMDYWKANCPYLVGSYANKDIWQAYIHDIGLKAYGQEWFDRFLAYPKFYAQYWNEYSPDKAPSLPSFMPTYDIYQYTQYGDSFGYVDGSLWRRYGSPDLDVFNGTMSDMRVWLGLTTEPPVEPPPVDPPPPPQEIDMTYQFVVANPDSSVLNLRATTSAAPPDAGDAPNGSICYSDAAPIDTGDGFKWLKVTSGTGLILAAGYSLPLYVATYFNGKSRGTLTENAAPPPDGDPVTVEVKVNGAVVYSYP